MCAGFLRVYIKLLHVGKLFFVFWNSFFFSLPHLCVIMFRPDPLSSATCMWMSLLHILSVNITASVGLRKRPCDVSVNISCIKNHYGLRKRPCDISVNISCLKNHYRFFPIVKPTRCINGWNLSAMCCTLYYNIHTCSLVILPISGISVSHMPVPVCTVFNSRWWTERPSEACTVLLQIK